MTIENVSQGSAFGLPQAVRTAQDAIHLPEVQEKLRRLSEFNPGIFMPHMHDTHTGEFLLLPDETVQVESGLEVSFQRSNEIADLIDRFLPVGWHWRDGASAASAVCEMVKDETSGDTEGNPKHKMLN